MPTIFDVVLCSVYNDMLIERQYQKYEAQAPGFLFISRLISHISKISTPTIYKYTL